MKRRDFFKLGLLSVLAATASTGFMKIYKHHSGVKEILEFPAPILRKISSPVDAIGDKIILNGILFIDYEHAGLHT